MDVHGIPLRRRSCLKVRSPRTSVTEVGCKNFTSS
jgi:hypothetical protein